jgi:hypothetical protein
MFQRGYPDHAWTHLLHPNCMPSSFLHLPHVYNCEFFILQWGEKKLTPNVTPNTLECMINILYFQAY